jgi:hypothetical protein
VKRALQIFGQEGLKEDFAAQISRFLETMKTTVPPEGSQNNTFYFAYLTSWVMRTKRAEGQFTDWR